MRVCNANSNSLLTSIQMRCFRTSSPPSTYTSASPIEMSTQSLPAELIDHVLQYLSSDKSTLANCTLVCQLWLRLSSRILFSELILRPGFHGTRRPDLSWFDSFLLDLQGLPRLKESVRKLSLFSGHLNVIPECHVTVLQHILAQLPRLESLHISYLGITPQDPSSVAAGLPVLPTRLKLHTVSLCNVLGITTSTISQLEPECDPLPAFMSLFEEIDHLVLNNFGLLFNASEQLSEPTQPPIQDLSRLRAVYLHGSDASKTIYRLHNMISPGHLSKLSLELTPHALHSINEALGSLSNLNTINLNLSGLQSDILEWVVGYRGTSHCLVAPRICTYDEPRSHRAFRACQMFTAEDALSILRAVPYSPSFRPRQ